MKIVRNPVEMQCEMEKLRNDGKTIAFVPTMGFLHEGHASLMKIGRGKADVLVVSIFVNPTQFGPNEDIEKYPRDFARDEQTCIQKGVDFLFYPDNNDMYPEGCGTYVTVEALTTNLCGESRPVHFRGVTTICEKFFNLVKPHYAVFGWKDAQQLLVIKKMVADLNIDVKIIGGETVREKDGLAMSSRNAYLSEVERNQATCLRKSLLLAELLIDGGERDANKIRAEMVSLIEGNDQAKIDYVSIVDINTIDEISEIQIGNTLVALAVCFGKTRLIDNVRC